jgi:uncharacterized repeat protein (TIGR01451 family)
VLNATVGTLNASDTGTLTFRVRVANSMPAGITPITNTAHLQAAQRSVPFDSNNATVNVTAVPVLTIAKSASPASPAAGDLLTYTLTFGNVGNATANTVMLEDVLPNDTSFVAGSIRLQGAAQTDANDGDAAYYDAVLNRVVWNVGNMSAGTTGLTAIFQARIAAIMPAGTTPVTNTATASASNAASVSGSATSSTTATPVLNVSKRASAMLVRAGERITYTVAYGVQGDAIAPGVVVTDAVPANATIVSGSITGGGTLSGGIVTWNLGDLPPGTAGNVSYVVTANSNG